MEPHYILRKPLLTEKSTQAMEGANVYAFEVDRRATKTDIKNAIEAAFGVTVVKINTQNRKGGSRRLRYGTVKAGEWKRASVRIKDGQTIELF